MQVYQPHLISAILNEPWAIEEKAVHDLSVTIGNILNQGVVFEKGEPVAPSTHVVIAGSAGPGGRKPQSGKSVNVAVITISGPLTKNDQYCGPAGMKSIGAWIKNADRDPDISGILLSIDSPGGTVAGTEELGNIIRDTKKPVVAFVDDLAASAGYWLASQADEIIANNSTAQVGSIGVLLSFMDIQPALELQGVKFHVITAPQSGDKVKTWNQLRAGNYEEYKENILKPLAEKFINTVKSARPAIKDEQTTANLYFAKDVVGSLVDSIGSFDVALQRVADLSVNSNLPNTKPNMNKPDLKRLAKASGVDAFESADGSITLTADQAVTVERALEAHETANAALQQKVTNSSNQQARVTELEGQLQTANERIVELEKDPDDKSATVQKETDGTGDPAEEGFFERFSRLKNLKNK
jgi:signal peptide peptidase SppA